ncbi:hypothetical protein NE237_012083 [Protea cynaroides]|uniref:Uncharacterized protein n=1 Tax=Protea cynaroides TaxID=273540 RepID=A0A9Q0GZG8_9MAGN|nr:hypothetical protein NE237_012083 [Protea cynaroides]
MSWKILRIAAKPIGLSSEMVASSKENQRSRIILGERHSIRSAMPSLHSILVLNRFSPVMVSRIILSLVALNIGILGKLQCILFVCHCLDKTDLTNEKLGRWPMKRPTTINCSSSSSLATSTAGHTPSFGFCLLDDGQLLVDHGFCPPEEEGTWLNGLVDGSGGKSSHLLCEQDGSG